MNEEIFMPNKTIDVCLTKVNNNNTLIFSFGDGKININLESNDTNTIKEVFQRIAKELCENDITFNYSIDKINIDESKDGLFIDATREYIGCLESEIASLKEDEYLKIIRTNDNSNN